MAIDDRARKALLFFHNKSLSYSGYKITFDQLLTALYKTNASKNLPILDRAILNSELNETEIKKIFEGLAMQGQGRIPKSANTFFDALIGEAGSVSWVDVKVEAIQAVKDVSNVVVDAGQSVLTSFKALTFILPFLVVGVVVYIVYSKTKAVTQ